MKLFYTLLFFLKRIKRNFYNRFDGFFLKGPEHISKSLKTRLYDLKAKKRRFIEGISTGYSSLDSFMLGMKPGQFIVMGARPGMGKSLLALKIAIEACKNSDQPVIYFSLDKNTNQIAERILSSEGAVSFSKIFRQNNFNDEELANLEEVSGNISLIKFYLHYRKCTNISDIKYQSRIVKHKKGLSLVVIDKVQLLNERSSGESNNKSLTRVLKELRKLAEELDCVVIVTSDIKKVSKKRYKKENYSPRISDLPVPLQEIPDTVMLLHREDYYDLNADEAGIANIIIPKAFYGNVGNARIAWIADQLKFSEIRFVSLDIV